MEEALLKKGQKRTAKARSQRNETPVSRRKNSNTHTLAVDTIVPNLVLHGGVGCFDRKAQRPNFQVGSLSQSVNKHVHTIGNPEAAGMFEKTACAIETHFGAARDSTTRAESTFMRQRKIFLQFAVPQLRGSSPSTCPSPRSIHINWRRTVQKIGTGIQPKDPSPPPRTKSCLLR